MDFLVVLDSQRQALITRDALVQAEVAQATGLVAVYRALGGGWPQAQAQTAPSSEPAAVSEASFAAGGLNPPDTRRR